jgi:cytosine deaminase
MAREFDVAIDMHLDFGNTPDNMDVEYVCEQTEKFGYGGRVTVGHVTKLSTVPMERFASTARRLADVGVAVTVLPSTDLYLMGRHQNYNVIRGVTPVHKLLQAGVNCSLSTNNVLNPFTPFGDCSLLRMANLYANICHVGKRDEMRECFEMVTRRSAQILGLEDYGIAIGKSADLVVLDCAERQSAIAELAVPLYGFKRGRLTFTRKPAELQRP